MTTALPLLARFEGLSSPEQVSPLQTAIIAGVVVGLLGALFLVNAYNNHKAAVNGHPGRNPGGKQSLRAFRKAAGKLGLSKGQTTILENIIKQFKVTNPFTMLNNTSTFDTILGRALEHLDNTALEENSRESQKLQIYKIKQIIERESSRRKNSLKSTRQLHLGEEIRLKTASGEIYTTHITVKLSDFLCAEPPRDKEGAIIPLAKNLPVQMMVTHPGKEQILFATQTLGFMKRRGVNSLKLAHSQEGKVSQKRRYRRREVKRPCYFYPVQIITQGRGRKAKKEAVVMRQNRFLGTLLDLSAGGCSINTRKALTKGQLLKLEFESHNRESISVLGKIVRVHDTKPYGRVMHIMFTRASSSNINRINAFVYDM